MSGFHIKSDIAPGSGTFEPADYRAANGCTQTAFPGPLSGLLDVVARPSIPCRPLRNAPRALAEVSPSGAASPTTNALPTITVAPIPLQWYAFEWAGLEWYEMVTTSIHWMAMQSYGRAGRPDVASVSFDKQIDHRRSFSYSCAEQVQHLPPEHADTRLRQRCVGHRGSVQADTL